MIQNQENTWSDRREVKALTTWMESTVIKFFFLITDC